MKNLKNLGKSISRAEQKEINGGFGRRRGCQAQLIQCESDFDCPSCSAGCGIVINKPNGPISLGNICAF